MNRTAPFLLFVVTAPLLLSCANVRDRSRPVRFLLADHDLPKVGESEAAVRDALGRATYIMGARNGTETFYYFDARFDGCTRGCVRVEIQNDRALSVAETDTHPPLHAQDGVIPRRRVTDGAVRLGVSEVVVREALGAPHGLTANNGVETMHYLTKIGIERRPRTDSLIALIDGQVVAYGERYLDGYATNLPVPGNTSPTGGDVRVGMTPEDVVAEVGEPTRRDLTTTGRDVYVYVAGSRTPGEPADIVQLVFFDRGGHVSGLAVDNLKMRRQRTTVDENAYRARFWQSADTSP